MTNDHITDNRTRPTSSRPGTKITNAARKSIGCLALALALGALGALSATSHHRAFDFLDFGSAVIFFASSLCGLFGTIAAALGLFGPRKRLAAGVMLANAAWSITLLLSTKPWT